MNRLPVFLLLFLTACKVGPNYRKPDLSLPDAFSEAKSGETVTDADFCKWWEHWNDETLNGLVEEAVGFNFDIRIALEKIIQARSYYRIESSYLWPEVNLQAAATRSRYSQNIFSNPTSLESLAHGQSSTASTGLTQSVSSSLFTSPIQNFFLVGFDAVWELDFWGKIRRGKEAAFDEWEAVKFQAQDVMLTTVSEVIQKYVNIRSLQAQMRVLAKQIELQKKNVDLERDLDNAGLSAERDLEERIIALEQEEARMPTLDSLYKQNIYALAVLLGRDPEGLPSLFEKPADIPGSLGKVPAGLPSDLLRRRPDVRSAERELAAATARIGVAVANYFPSISLTGDGFGYESSRQYQWIVPGSRYWTVGPNIQWNIIDFGKTRAQVASANSVQRQALLQYEKTVVGALQDVEGALVAYFDEQEKYLHILQEKKAALIFYELTKDLFEAGLIDEIQLMEAESIFLDKESVSLQSEQALANDLVALYKALGGNWECSPTP